MARMYNGRLIENIKIEGARLVFKNFSGLRGQYNAEGDRNFCVLIDPETAETLADFGWNIKYLRAKDPDEEDQAYLKVFVKYDEDRPSLDPDIYLVVNGRKTKLNAETVGRIDFAQIINADIIIRPYVWNRPDGASGIKPFVDELYVTIAKDTFAEKYQDVPDSAETSVEFE